MFRDGGNDPVPELLYVVLVSEVVKGGKEFMYGLMDLPYNILFRLVLSLFNEFL